MFLTSDLEHCKQIWEDWGMQTMQDWLRYYNVLDVAPGLEAITKIKAFYTHWGKDIFKDTVSIPGVSMQLVLRATINRGANLWSPDKTAYDMLKAAVVGGPSLVFTRYQVSSVPKIPNHRGSQAAFKKILGFDVNAMYLSTSAKDMSCGPGEFRIWNDAVELARRLRAGEWFGFAEVYIEITCELWPKFEEICPFFVNKIIAE